MLVETKAKVGVFAIALGAYLPQFPTLVPEFEALERGNRSAAWRYVRKCRR